MIQLVFATAYTKTVNGEEQLAFGYRNDLPWKKISQDMSNFKSRTKETILIMGANTFASLPRKLDGRIHIVVCDPSRELPVTKISKSKANIYISESTFNGFLDNESFELNYTDDYPWPHIFNRTANKYSIIGGKSLIEASLDKVDKIVYTTIRKKHHVVSDVQLNMQKIKKMQNERNMTSSSWWYIDELTELSESVYEGQKEYVHPNFN